MPCVVCRYYVDDAIDVGVTSGAASPWPRWHFYCHPWCFGRVIERARAEIEQELQWIEFLRRWGAPANTAENPQAPENR